MATTKRVCIVGGVAAGMSCAMRLKRLREDIDIHVFERGPDVSIASCGMPYYIGGEIKDRAKLSVVTAAWAKARYDVSVHLRSEVVGINRDTHTIAVKDLATGAVADHAYDKLVLAPGARPVTAGIAGTDLPGVYSLRSLADMDGVAGLVSQGKRAVIIGGSFIGLEVAEAFVHKGVRTTVVELLGQVLGVFDPEMAVPLQMSLEHHGVDCRLGRKTQSIDKGADSPLVVTLDDGSKIPADVVVLSIGVTPDSRLASSCGLGLGVNNTILVDDHMRTTDPDIYACGDAVQVNNYVLDKPMMLALAGPASRQGRVAAANIAGRDERFGGVNGTAIVRVFEHTAACTGLSEKLAKRFGVADVEKLYAIQANAVEWLPGAAPMIIKMLFDRKSGRIVGAQAVGRLGVDKRIDVLSTAIQAGMTVRQLSQVELTYAPPYNGPKDPVNTAGFIACNIMDGLVKMTFPDSLPADAVLVDLREAAELPVQGVVPGAICITAGQLRQRYTELPKDKPVVLICKVGGRGNAAYRFLAQKGFTNIYDLSGGALVNHLFHTPQQYKQLIANKVF
eukprot:m51a1_g10681 putative CoA-disulfide reductase (563) ;mRNA; r:84786-87336